MKSRKERGGWPNVVTGKRFNISTRLAHRREKLSNGGAIFCWKGEKRGLISFRMGNNRG